MLKLPKVIAASLLMGDTSSASINVGDLIIREAVVNQIGKLFPEKRFISVPTQTPLGKRGRVLVRGNRKVLVAGTNIVGLDRWRTRSWRMSPYDVLVCPNSYLLFGCGLFSYKAETSVLSERFLRRILSKGPHSVRDEYTANYLKKIGISNVYATGCPTVWELDNNLIAKAWSKGKTSEVVISFNNNKQSDAVIENMVKTLSASYERVHVWLQRPLDFFPEQLRRSNVSIIPPRLEALDAALKGRDYIGARLHAGVRALQSGSRALIISVDNRAIEMSKTSGLPVCISDDTQKAINAFIESSYVCPVVNVDQTQLDEYKTALVDFIS